MFIKYHQSMHDSSYFCWRIHRFRIDIINCIWEMLHSLTYIHLLLFFIMICRLYGYIQISQQSYTYVDLLRIFTAQLFQISFRTVKCSMKSYSWASCSSEIMLSHSTVSQMEHQFCLTSFWTKCLEILLPGTCYLSVNLFWSLGG